MSVHGAYGVGTVPSQLTCNRVHRTTNFQMSYKRVPQVVKAKFLRCALCATAIALTFLLFVALTHKARTSQQVVKLLRERAGPDFQIPFGLFRPKISFVAFWPY